MSNSCWPPSGKITLEVGWSAEFQFGAILSLSRAPSRRTGVPRSVPLRLLRELLLRIPNAWDLSEVWRLEFEAFFSCPLRTNLPTCPRPQSVAPGLRHRSSDAIFASLGPALAPRRSRGSFRSRAFP